MNYALPEFNCQRRPLRVGTDCSGLETPLIALKMLNVDVEHMWSCDNDPHIKKHILEHHNPFIYYDNIFDRNHNELPDIDLYVCGFCCQPFSSIGLRQGFECQNGTVFYEVYNTILCKSPKYFVLENVRNITEHKKGETYKTIKEMLSKLNYNISYHVLNTMDYGIPQHRRRLYIVGVKNETFTLLPYTKPCPSVREFVDTTMIGQVGRCLIPRRQGILNHVVMKKNVKVEDDWVITTGSSASYARSNKDYSPCITANCRFYYITSLQRFLTPRELSNLQGFPEDMPLANNGQAYKQIGNAMSCNVVYHILASLLCANNSDLPECFSQSL